MPKPLTAKDMGIDGYKIRLVVPNAVIHLLSSSEPEVHLDPQTGLVQALHYNAVVNSKHGDTLGFIRWSEVTAISWRKL